MPAPKGNDYSRKWKTQEERRQAFQALCDHLESGLSKKSFPLADWDTVEAYCRDFPEDFPPEKLQEAMRRHLLVWEKIGIQGAQGKIEGFNAASWIFNMKNRFKEDWRDKVEQEHSGTMAVVKVNDTDERI